MVGGRSDGWHVVVGSHLLLSVLMGGGDVFSKEWMLNSVPCGSLEC